MDISDYRKEIDRIDKQLINLFEERLEVAKGIAEYKKNNNLPILDPERERQKLYDITSMCREDIASYNSSIFSLLFDISKAYQSKLVESSSDISEKIVNAMETSPKALPSKAIVACHGAEGSYSQQACEKMFASPQIMYFNSFEGVFQAIENGLCQYGILPVENSIAGTVNKTYDLMMKHDFNIVKSTRVKVDHGLMVNHGVNLQDIKEIYSHEQAIAQCEGFLKTMPNVKVIPCENTATAAKYIYESGRTDAACLASVNCALLYNLDCLKTSVQDQSSNYTRFICISKKLEIYPGADTTSIMLTVRHKTGALFKVLSMLFALGVNMKKLESRPLPNTDFEFMFYFDLDVSIYQDNFLQIFNELENICTSLKYLGSYNEIL